jgi:hypothetical protein
MSALATDGQATTVAIATVRADVHEPLDVHRDFGAEGALYTKILFDGLSQAVGVCVIEIADALIGIHPGAVEDASRGGAADPEDVGKSDLEFLLAWQIHAGDTCH